MVRNQLTFSYLHDYVFGRTSRKTGKGSGNHFPSGGQPQRFPGGNRENFRLVRADITRLDGRIDKIETRMDRLETRMERLEEGQQVIIDLLREKLK
ncbi:hypothetical protein [Tellurirhabdus rosea]|uniref:hypothetical protein n=1 Tax=Tellurirhabdus rosea TaxID=2674997 RepID=UPI00224ED91E|nr:hypothetical protein [Tellurirhabdus rosea]